jgi:sodium/potassium/calcium exchanger 6
VVDDGNREEGAGDIALPEGEDEPLVPDSEDRHPNDHWEEEEEEEDDDDPYLRPDVGEGLHQLVEGGFSPLHSPLGRIHHSARRFEESLHDDDEDGEEGDEEITKELIEEMEEEEALRFNKSLCAAQCVLGPTFCSYIVFGRFPPHPSIRIRAPLF